MVKNTDIVINVSGITKKFGSLTALDEISLHVRKGHIHGFLGPNGAGKSTTIKLLMDFIRPTKGEVTIFGENIRNNPSLHRRIGFLTGDMELYDNLSGHQYLSYIARLKGEKNYTHLSAMIDDLEPVLDRRIGTLSRGNKQKIGLLAALMNDPDLLILDEPTTGLDPLMQQKFYQALRSYARRGKTVFMSSHILSEVQEVCDVITFMKQGKVIETVAVASLLGGAKRHVEMRFNKSATVLDPSPRLGYENLQRTKTTLKFDVKSADRILLRWIATQPVEDVTITESSLDNVFLGMYDDGEKK